ncbi:hypothetical protein JNW90_30710 [Micromonospora sp. STR1s_5]|nr:hypothetical protein [Micromonospora sp. STR1s_5]
MTIRRRLDWSTSMRDYRASAPVNPMAAPLVAAGRFDRKAIMLRAVAIARTLRAGGKAWAWRMSIALKSAWAAAKRHPAAPVRLAA